MCWGPRLGCIAWHKQSELLPAASDPPARPSYYSAGEAWRENQEERQSAIYGIREGSCGVSAKRWRRRREAEVMREQKLKPEAEAGSRKCTHART